MSKVILFQGDSITDAVRDRNSSFNDGYGYATAAGHALIAREWLDGFKRLIEN